MKLLIQGTTILAQDVTETDDSIVAPDIVYPKQSLDGWQIVDILVPDGFVCDDYQYVDGALQAWKRPLTKEEFNAAIDAQISVLEAKITQRRLREALLSGDHAFIDSINSQIVTLRGQRQ